LQGTNIADLPTIISFKVSKILSTSFCFSIVALALKDVKLLFDQKKQKPRDIIDLRKVLHLVCVNLFNLNMNNGSKSQIFSSCSDIT